MRGQRSDSSDDSNVERAPSLVEQAVVTCPLPPYQLN